MKSLTSHSRYSRRMNTIFNLDLRHKQRTMHLNVLTSLRTLIEWRLELHYIRFVSFLCTFYVYDSYSCIVSKYWTKLVHTTYTFMNIGWIIFYYPKLNITRSLIRYAVFEVDVTTNTKKMVHEIKLPIMVG